MTTIAQTGLSAQGVPVSTRADVAAAIDAVNAIAGIPTARVGAKGWLDSFIGTGYEASSGQLVSMSAHGGAGGVFATRSGDQAQTGAQSGYAIGTFALNTNTANSQTVYAGYFESCRSAGAGFTHGVEIDVTNEGSRVTQSPYLMIPDGATPGLWLAAFGSRRGNPVNDASIAIGIIANGAKFASGIVFSTGSVAGNVDAFVPPIALDMPETYAIVWRNHVNAQPVANIRSDCTQPATTSGGGGSIVFADNGVNHQSQNGAAQILVSNSGVQIGNLNDVGSATFRGAVAVLFPASYATDAAAATGGVGASQLYLRSDGSIHVRLS